MALLFSNGCSQFKVSAFERAEDTRFSFFREWQSFEWHFLPCAASECRPIDQSYPRGSPIFEL
ncbi:hypothetical protein EBU99_05220 [bacterium]|nr:hypothetical protein [bacterium]